ncbi:MAG: hypothetical protein GWM87_05470, partial [Xanthomonadales bacterium]|nr:hypothetical protein [Xanthomonadales bacterium]NIW36527.1 hypothetical protein [Gemmatimonadota bacterium]NIX12434.1 hypothetical protein [Xanthomonadales bacterium]
MSSWVCRGAALLALTQVTGALRAEPLPAAIDRHLGELAGGSPAPLADDTEFLRRLHLDLAGNIP